MRTFDELKYKFLTLNLAEKLIVVNAAIYVVNSLVVFLFQLDENVLMKWFELPKDFSEFILQPWSIITYAFFHASLMHIFWNMLLLYYIARTYFNLLPVKYFVNLYFMGALFGGAFYLLSYNVFPVFSQTHSSLVGASAAIMAVFIFLCVYLPNLEVRLIFFNTKLFYIGLAFVLLDIIQIPFGNAGGHIAHLGGALFGYLYAKQFEKDKVGSESNFSSWFRKKKKPPFKKVYRNTTNINKELEIERKQEQIDAILDKISKSGYESLSSQEKDFLFRAGKGD